MNKVSVEKRQEAIEDINKAVDLIEKKHKVEIDFNFIVK